MIYALCGNKHVLQVIPAVRHTLLKPADPFSACNKPADLQIYTTLFSKIKFPFLKYSVLETLGQVQ